MNVVAVASQVSIVFKDVSNINDVKHLSLSACGWVFHGLLCTGRVVDFLL